MPNTLIQFTDIGADTGPFTITESSPLATLATGITRAQLLAGFYVTTSVAATTVTVTSTGTCTDTATLDIISEAIGYLNLPGTTHVESWQFDNQIKATPRALSSNSTMGAKEGFTIVQAGVLSGGGILNIAGTATNLDPFNGGGTVVLAADNTNTQITNVQDGATLQLGRGVDIVGGSINGAMTVLPGGTALLVGADRGQSVKVQGAVTNGGTLEVRGPGIDGQGRMEASSNLTMQAGSTTDIYDADFHVGNILQGPGEVTVHDGATLRLGNGNTSTVDKTANVSGCGWKDINGVEQGALNFEAVNQSDNMIINTTGPVCFVRTATSAATQNNSVALSGNITGTGPIRVSHQGPQVANATNAEFRFFGPERAYDGTVIADGGRMSIATDALRNANIVLENTAELVPRGTVAAITTLNSTDPTSTIKFPATTILEIIGGPSTFAGTILNTGTAGGVVQVTGADAQLTLTSTATSATRVVRSRDGGKLIVDGAVFTGTGRIDTSGTNAVISAGTSTTGNTNISQIVATSILDVVAISPTSVGLMRTLGTNTLTLPPNNTAPIGGAWTVNVPDGLQAGTYPIWEHNSAAQSQANRIPFTNVNNTGLNVTYAWDTSALPNRLMMTLAP